MEIARLQIAVDASQVPKGTKNLKDLGAESKRTEAAVKSASSAVKQFVSALAIGATINKVIAATVEQERVTAQLEATLKSTGRYTPELSARLQAMAGDLQQVTTFGDESVIAMQSLLLTFTQIGGKEFDRAQKAILDVATAMGTDLKAAALQVGKALNDPIKGVSALAESGIQFSESQKEVIKQLTETGRVAEAQGIILEELERQFGGSAEAARNTLGGALKSLQNTFGDLLEGSGGNVTETTQAINDLNAALSDPQIKAAFDTIVAGVLSVTTAVANALPEIVSFTRWAAEELAVLVGGIAGDDIVRLEKRAQDLADSLSMLQANELADHPNFELTRKALDEVNEQIDEYYAKLQRPQPTAPGADSGVIALINSTSTETKKLTGATQKLSEAQRKAIRDQEKMQAATKANADVIGDLAEALYQATLPADELAKRQAELRLNEYASAEQVAQVRSLAGELQRLQDIESRKREFGSDPSATIRGNVSPLSGGAFDDQLARYEAEREAEELRYAEQQARLQEAQELRLLSQQEFYILEEQLARENADRLAQIETAKQQMLLGTGEQVFGDLASMAKTYAGEQSSLYKTMFAASKAFAIAQAAVSIGQGIAMAAANPWPTNLAAMASVAAATASLVGNISSVAMESFEGGGFTGSGPRTGGMDGKGGFMAMVHPNETIIDHTKGQGMGGGVIVNVIESSQKAGTQEKRTDVDGRESVDVFVADIYGDGPRARAMQNAFGLQRQGR